MVYLSGCESETKYGKCIGFEDGNRNPKIVYKISVQNAVVSLILIETVIVPVYWVTDYALCPVANKIDE